MPNTDFDFLKGEFHIRNERLNERLCGCDDWSEFDADFRGYGVLGGAGFIDEMRADLQGQPFHGMTLRLYDPEQDQWSLHWADNRHPQLCPPMVGRFSGKRGEFFGKERHAGRSVDCRFTWTLLDRGHALWEQAFSEDGGQSWETNWRMHFTPKASG